MKVNDIKKPVKEVTVNLGGKERPLRFDMNAFAELESRFGSIDAAMERLQESKLGDIRLMLWVGLIHNEVAEFDEITGEPVRYNITPYQVGSYIENMGQLQELSVALGQALTQGMPDPESLPEEVKAGLEAQGVNIETLRKNTEAEGVQLAVLEPSTEPVVEDEGKNG